MRAGPARPSALIFRRASPGDRAAPRGNGARQNGAGIAAAATPDRRGATYGPGPLIETRLPISRSFLHTRVRCDSAVGMAQGLRTGIVDLLKTDRQTRPTFLTLDRHTYIIGFWLMNERSYRLMPLDLQQIVQLGFDELRRITLTFPDNREAEALDTFRADGGQIYVPTVDEKRSFVAAAGRVSTWFMDIYGYEWLVWLEGAIAEAERELSSLSQQ